jgi:hypothetical protein
MDRVHIPVWQQRLARWSGKGMTAVLWVMGLPVVLMIASTTANWADSQVGGPNLFGPGSSVWAYRVPVEMPQAAPCSGALCSVQAVVPRFQTLPAAKGYVSTTAVLQLPPALTLNAPEGGFIQVVGMSRADPPVLARKAVGWDEVAADAGPLTLANLMLGETTQAVRVDDEGYLLAWALLDDAPGSEPRRWTPDSQGTPNRSKTTLNGQGPGAWPDRKLRTLRFQPMPRTIDVVVANDNQAGDIPVGQVAVISWGTTPPANDNSSQLSTAKGMVGVVRAVKEQGSQRIFSVELPRETPYGGSNHWLVNRMHTMGADAAVIPLDVRVEFFAPAQPEPQAGSEDRSGRAAFTRLERQYFKLPRVEMKTVATSALDFECAAPRANDHACLWAALEGVAVPVQVKVWHRMGAQAFVHERSTFAGKPVTADHWAALPSAVRRNMLRYGSPIRDKVPVALKPLPPQAAGQPIGTEVRQP